MWRKTVWQEFQGEHEGVELMGKVAEKNARFFAIWIKWEYDEVSLGENLIKKGDIDMNTGKAGGAGKGSPLRRELKTAKKEEAVGKKGGKTVKQMQKKHGEAIMSSVRSATQRKRHEERPGALVTERKAEAKSAEVKQAGVAQARAVDFDGALAQAKEIGGVVDKVVEFYATDIKEALGKAGGEGMGEALNEARKDMVRGFRAMAEGVGHQIKDLGQMFRQTAVSGTDEKAGMKSAVGEALTGGVDKKEIKGALAQMNREVNLVMNEALGMLEGIEEGQPINEAKMMEIFGKMEELGKKHIGDLGKLRAKLPKESNLGKALEAAELGFGKLLGMFKNVSDVEGELGKMETAVMVRLGRTLDQFHFGPPEKNALKKALTEGQFDTKAQEALGKLQKKAVATKRVKTILIITTILTSLIGIGLFYIPIFIALIGHARQKRNKLEGQMEDLGGIAKKLGDEKLSSEEIMGRLLKQFSSIRVYDEQTYKYVEKNVDDGIMQMLDGMET